MKKLLALLFTLPLCAFAASDLDLSEASRIVIQAGGRKKPLDTYAAESLQAMTGRRSLKDPESAKPLQPLDALFALWFGTRDWRTAPTILVSDPALRKELGITEKMVSFKTLIENPWLKQAQTRLSSTARGELSAVDKEAERILGRMEIFNQLTTGSALAIIPNPAGAKAEWLKPGSLGSAYPPETAQRITDSIKKIAAAYGARDNSAFSAETAAFRQLLAGLAPAAYPAASAIEREIHYNHLHPFRWAWLLYLGAFFMLLAPRAAAVGNAIFAAGLAMQIYGFALRILIAGHAPVTNMYESVVWVSLGIALFALILGLIYRSRVYLLTAAPLAVLGLILSDMLPSVLDGSIGPLPPVLRDNFWLVTHVLTITLGYAAFALAMGLGHVILFLSLVKPASVGQRSPYHHLLYRVLQIGVLLLAAGTILGGVWANYSWGRFWGWDPKETWALIALLLYIFALHGKIAGWWGNFGLAVSASVCFNGVLMAWYGVNFVLGKGLHSYGFGGGGGKTIGALVAADLAFIVFCVIRHPRSGKAPAAALDPISPPVTGLNPTR